MIRKFGSRCKREQQSWVNDVDDVFAKRMKEGPTMTSIGQLWGGEGGGGRRAAFVQLLSADANARSFDLGRRLTVWSSHTFDFLILAVAKIKLSIRCMVGGELLFHLWMVSGCVIRMGGVISGRFPLIVEIITYITGFYVLLHTYQVLCLLLAHESRGRRNLNWS